MGDKILLDLKKYIRQNLEDKISHIIKNNSMVRSLSKRDLITLVNFMKKNRIYSRSVLKYIYIKSDYRYCEDLPKLTHETLIDSISRCNFDVMRFLLELPHEVKLRSTREIGPTVFHNRPIRIACGIAKGIGIQKYLLSDKMKELYPNNHVDPSDNNNEAIRFASGRGNIEVVKYLLSDEMVGLFPTIDPSAWENDAVVQACKNGHVEVLRFLLSDEITGRYGIIPSIRDNLAIKHACYYGHIEVVKLLLCVEVRAKYSIWPSTEDNYAIRCASEKGNIEIVRFLLSEEIQEYCRYIDPSDLGNDAIKRASTKGHIDIVKLLLKDRRVIEKGLSNKDIDFSTSNPDRPNIKDIKNLLLTIKHKN